MALDRPYLERQLREIEGYVSLLRTLAARDAAEFRRDPIAFHAAQHLLQISIEGMVSIGHEMISDLALPTPESHAQLLETLHGAGVLPDPTMLPRYQAMIRFRNLVVHRYWEVDPARVHEILRDHLGNFERFAKDIVTYLDRAASPGDPGGGTPPPRQR